MTTPFDPAMTQFYPALIGCDEAGRGALCGPVVVAAVWFDPATVPKALFGALDDSKRLPAKRREFLAQEILNVARVAIAASSARRIDGSNIRTMTLDAMRRAVLRLAIREPVRIDGIDIPPGIDLPCEAVIKGDSTVPQIAAASIIAKTYRDRLMARLAGRHPDYSWERNAGYGTADHLAALEQLGPTQHHRRSFRPVSQYAFVGAKFSP
jgi:ribonuclease HII